MITKELFLPYIRIPYTDDKIKEEYIEIFNEKKNMYEAIYQYNGKPSSQTAIVDKVFLDFDPGEDMSFFKDTQIVAKYLYEHDMRFYVRFSGRGFHIFILIKQNKLSSPKMAIKRFVHFLHKETNTKSDPAVVGDLRRTSRLLNTMNLKTERYCISLAYSELQNYTYDEIYSLASKPRDEDFILGKTLLDLSEYDKPMKSNNHIHIVSHKRDTTNEIPPCVKEFLKNPRLSHTERMQVILYYRDLGYTKEEVEDILYKTLNEDRFDHCMHQEHQIDQLFYRDYLTFSNCNVQKLNGFCPSETCPGCALYY